MGWRYLISKRSLEWVEWRKPARITRRSHSDWGTSPPRSLWLKLLLSQWRRWQSDRGLKCHLLCSCDSRRFGRFGNVHWKSFYNGQSALFNINMWALEKAANSANLWYVRKLHERLEDSFEHMGWLRFVQHCSSGCFFHLSGNKLKPMFDHSVWIELLLHYVGLSACVFQVLLLQENVIFGSVYWASKQTKARGPDDESHEAWREWSALCTFFTPSTPFSFIAAEGLFDAQVAERNDEEEASDSGDGEIEVGLLGWWPWILAQCMTVD